ncbi:hypothetical protein BDZ89DRAFT_1047719 [Hymenopellis radicata]|nr:hypothetical protein BDZ89DRAFT_1047719 [Hymenopellis radicata]
MEIDFASSPHSPAKLGGIRATTATATAKFGSQARVTRYANLGSKRYSTTTEIHPSRHHLSSTSALVATAYRSPRKQIFDNLSDDVDKRSTKTTTHVVLNTLYHPHSYTSPARVSKMTKETSLVLIEYAYNLDIPDEVMDHPLKPTWNDAVEVFNIRSRSHQAAAIKSCDSARGGVAIMLGRARTALLCSSHHHPHEHGCSHFHIYPKVHSPAMLSAQEQTLPHGREDLQFWCGGAALCDILIAAFMTHYLPDVHHTQLAKYDTGFRHTQRLILKLIHLTVETGTLTAVGALLDLILFFAFPFQELYANAMIIVINARLKIGISGVDDLKVRSAAVHAALADVPRDSTLIYVDNNTRIQILEGPMGGKVILIPRPFFRRQLGRGPSGPSLDVVYRLYNGLKSGRLTFPPISFWNVSSASTDASRPSMVFILLITTLADLGTVPMSPELLGTFLRNVALVTVQGVNNSSS